jgi:hypothetical protein
VPKTFCQTFNPVLLHARSTPGWKRNACAISSDYTRNPWARAGDRAQDPGRIPPQEIPSPRLGDRGYFCPAREVAGDFYDAFNLGEGMSHW